MGEVDETRRALGRLAGRPQGGGGAQKPREAGWEAAIAASAEAAAREAVEAGQAHVLTPPRVVAASGAPDWARIRREALEHGPGPFGLLMWQEERYGRA